ncbi:acetyltransferase [Helicobacter marmotae]|uniref:Acetyltransferase n=1 Tax=Helicobacter marmotae TaxID=152490 RepID=A0A3D8I6Z0_9HELI|nr:acetyltransferase [Helicobacter marmotae]RDU60766.1 acetyltransferase [Helicobacter marmotae]
MKPLLVLIGGGGHAKACIDVIEQENVYQIYGILDSLALQKGQKETLGYPILGGDELLEELFLHIKHAFIAIGQIKSPSIRAHIYQNLKAIGYHLPSIISPLAYVAKSAIIQEGSIIMHHALINANAKIGKACIINSKALVEHDCQVEDFCHLSTGSVINGHCFIGRGSFMGSNMILAHNTHIPPNSLIYHNPLESHLEQNFSQKQKDDILTGGGDKVKVLLYLYAIALFRFYISLARLYNPAHLLQTPIPSRMR